MHISGPTFRREAMCQIKSNSTTPVRNSTNQDKITFLQCFSSVNCLGGLVRSKYREDQENGVILLQEIYHEDPERQRECMYYLALGYYRLGEFTQSRKFNEMLLKSEPDNKQALSLRASIEKKLRRDGLLGAAVIGAAVTTIGVVLGALFAAKRR